MLWTKIKSPSLKQTAAMSARWRESIAARFAHAVRLRNKTSRQVGNVLEEHILMGIPVTAKIIPTNGGTQITC